LASKKQALGIDVSHYKNQIDWGRVAESGLKYAIIKATEGDDWVDSRFDYNWSQARKVGLLRGAYHFFRPVKDPLAQAHHFLRMVGDILHETDLPPVLDVEVYPSFIKNEYKKFSSRDRQQRIRVWLQTIEAATGRTPMIYTNYYSWRDYLGNSESFSRYPLWIAAYKVEQPKIPGNNWGGRGWTFWQYTEKGVVPGIRNEAACVDMNYFRGTDEDLKGWLNIEKPRAIPSSVTNGDMMVALIDTAESMGDSSDSWVARTGLRYLVDPIGNSLRPYDGPAIEDLPLNTQEKTALRAKLDSFGLNFAALGITHQDMINAIYYAASLEDQGGWPLVLKAGIGYIGEDRDAIYNGPALQDLPGLTWRQKAAIAAYLGIELVGGPVEMDEGGEFPTESEPENEKVEEVVETGLPATYSNELTNQAMINAFHLMALELDVSGQVLVASAGLEDLGEARNSVYSGPKIEDLPGLTWDLKLRLANLLSVSIVLPEDEIKIDVYDQDVEEEDQAQTDTLEEIGVEVEPEEDLPEITEDEAEIVGGQPEIPEIDPVEEQDSDYIEMDEDIFAELVDQLPVLDLTDDADNGEEEGWNPLITNQDVVEAIFEAAAALGREGWSLLGLAGLLDMDLEQAGRFAGLAVEKLEALGDDVLELVVDRLGIGSKGLLIRKEIPREPYPGMVNLDMVNLFFKAAAEAGENGQLWLNESGMSYLNKNRASRFKPYFGPEVTQLVKLSPERRVALQSVLEKSYQSE
jgi:GH25 family lysozyme M1 (1,4-beta-N-acetylmuramidase)